MPSNLLSLLRGLLGLHPDRRYFTGPKDNKGSALRHDLHAIVGGALAAAFIAAGLANIVNLPLADGWVTIIAGILGGIAGKYVIAA